MLQATTSVSTALTNRMETPELAARKDRIGDALWATRKVRLTMVPSALCHIECELVNRRSNPGSQIPPLISPAPAPTDASSPLPPPSR